MPDVKLEVLTITGMIAAPDFCPYATLVSIPGDFTLDSTLPAQMYTRRRGINPAICACCRVCSFFPDPEEFKHTDNSLNTVQKEKIVKNLLDDAQFLDAVHAQIVYLKGKERIPLAVFVNFELLERVIRGSMPSDTYQSGISYFTGLECPIAYIAGMPVYFSRKLTASKVLVFAELEWN